MTPTQVIDTTKQKLQIVIEHFQTELSKVRTGRANASMLDGITVDAYGTSMPLNQVATISAPEPQLLQISPFDPANLQAITGAIRDNQSLGLNPMDDGHVVRLPIPPLTEERRRELAKQLNEKVEDCMIAMRNVRHEMLKTAEQLKRDKDIGDDDYKRLEKQIDEAMAQHKIKVESLSKAKETEVLTI